MSSPVRKVRMWAILYRDCLDQVLSVSALSVLKTTFNARENISIVTASTDTIFFMQLMPGNHFIQITPKSPMEATCFNAFLVEILNALAGIGTPYSSQYQCQNWGPPVGSLWPLARVTHIASQRPGPGTNPAQLLAAAPGQPDLDWLTSEGCITMTVE